MEARIVIDDVHPRTTTGAYPAKCVTGEVVPVAADIFRDGHDVLAARVRWRAVGAGGKAWASAPLVETVNDRWVGNLIGSSELGHNEFVIDAWTDAYATWRHKLTVKLEARVDVSIELAEGIAFFTSRADEAEVAATAKLEAVATMLADESLDHTSRAASALTTDTAALVAEPGLADVITTSPPQSLWVDRPRAISGAWYCAFPRSHGGLEGFTEHLSYIAGLNMDVVYLTPIHPIGTAYRKGRNNTLTPTPDDPGSPFGIGSPDGGHTDIHPDLGTIADFDAMVARATELGLEIALDNALQCSPDHPWVKAHPEWFVHRPDGSIAYAENPPKKYQDIYPLNFWPSEESDRVAMWNACKGIFEFWISHGVRIFRVDNPHTKPLAFWHWCITEIQREHPDIVFLSEAFTRPKMMAKLAEIGFTQSYTYFTWRTNKWELTDYAVEVALGEKADFMRPNFWPNTHDILLPPLRNGSVGAFKSRLVLAATLVPTYGIYSGYELLENQPASSTNTDYLDSEKYEIKHRNFDVPHSLAPWIANINDARRRHAALQELRNIRFHGADNDQVICYSKRSADGTDRVLVVVNLDPDHTQECTVHLSLEELGIDANEPFEVYDEVTKRPFHWWGPSNYVRLDAQEPAHVLHIKQASA